jgi:hypothetical protein
MPKGLAVDRCGRIYTNISMDISKWLSVFGEPFPTFLPTFSGIAGITSIFTELFASFR